MLCKNFNVSVKEILKDGSEYQTVHHFGTYELALKCYNEIQRNKTIEIRTKKLDSTFIKSLFETSYHVEYTEYDEDETENGRYYIKYHKSEIL